MSEKRDKYDEKATEIVDKLTPDGGCARPWVNEMVAAAEAYDDAERAAIGTPFTATELVTGPAGIKKWRDGYNKAKEDAAMNIRIAKAHALRTPTPAPKEKNRG